MKLADAAQQYLKARRLMKDAERDLDEAKTILLEHFRKAKRSTIHGIAYGKSSYRQLDTKKARELLGDQAAAAEVVRTRETLTPVD
jgi:hypothetical protein